jgi:hypothetical protein
MLLRSAVAVYFESQTEHINTLQIQANLRPTVSRPVCLGVGHPSGTRHQFFFLLETFFRQLWDFYFVVPSLTRRQVCNLLYKLFLGLARAITLGTKSRRIHGHILLSHLRLSQSGGPGPHIYIPQEQGGSVIPPVTGFPFCLLLRLAGLRWSYSNPPPHGSHKYTLWGEWYMKIQFVPHRKHITSPLQRQLMLVGETVAVYCGNHTEHTETVRTSQETLLLHYRDQAINLVERYSRCVLWESCGTHKYIEWEKCRIFYVKSGGT